MQVFYELLKGLFFFATIGLAILFLRGEIFLGSDIYIQTIKTIIPGYLVLSGVMIGYIVSYMFDSSMKNNRVSVLSFFLGVLIGIALAITYILI